MVWWWLASLALAVDVRGMTVSCPTWGGEWGSDEMVATLDVLRLEGVNWVSIHPYARIFADGTVRFRPIDPDDPPEWLVRPIREAHTRGMKILIKPHLAYWGSPFSWRGAIEFDDPDARTRFFSTYEAWVTLLARVVSDADAFAVGTELGRLSGEEHAWRRIISQVRQRFPGHLTYAANWDEFDRVPFWDAVDAVGIQAYFPVLDNASASAPTDSELDAGWGRILDRIRAFAARTDRPIVFTELGYDWSVEAPVEPWATGRRTAEGEAVQRALLRAAMRAIEREPRVVGAFLWKWFPGERQHGDFRMSSPDNRAVIREMWKR